MGFVFFKRPKPKVFKYKPLFYDEEKEKREERRKALGLSDEDAGDIKVRLHERWKMHRASSKASSPLKTLIIYLFIIFILLYLIFFM